MFVYALQLWFEKRVNTVDILWPSSTSAMFLLEPGGITVDRFGAG
jgi:hypothetical protein